MRFRPTNVRLRNILYISRLDVNLIFISKLYIKDYVGEFNQNLIKIRYINDLNDIVLRVTKESKSSLQYIKDIFNKGDNI